MSSSEVKEEEDKSKDKTCNNELLQSDDTSIKDKSIESVKDTETNGEIQHKSASSDNESELYIDEVDNESKLYVDEADNESDTAPIEQKSIQCFVERTVTQTDEKREEPKSAVDEIRKSSQKNLFEKKQTEDEVNVNTQKAADGDRGKKEETDCCETTEKEQPLEQNSTDESDQRNANQKNSTPQDGLSKLMVQDANAPPSPLPEVDGNKDQQQQSSSPQKTISSPSSSSSSTTITATTFAVATKVSSPTAMTLASSGATNTVVSLALMRAPIQPTPVTRILPRPTTKKQLNTIITTTTTASLVNCSAYTSSTTSTVTPVSSATMEMATKLGGTKKVTGGGFASVRGLFTSVSTTAFTGAKIATGVSANGTGTSTTTKFAAVVPQRIGGTGGISCAAPSTPHVEVSSAKEHQMELNTTNSSSTLNTTASEMLASSMDKFADTVDRVAAGTEISPPQPSASMQQHMIVVTQSLATPTTLASSATLTQANGTAATPAMAKALMVVNAAAGVQLQQCVGAEKVHQLLKPKPPKKKKAPAASKAKNAVPMGADGNIGEATLSVVDMQQQQQQQQISSTASVFPVCSAVSSNAPGGGMIFPPNFAFAATPNGTVGGAAASLVAATYPNGGVGGGTQHYIIRQTTSSGHQQLIPLISSQQPFFFSPMPPAAASETIDANNGTANVPSTTTTLFHGQTVDDNQQRMIVQQQQQQQHVRMYFRPGNEIIMPAMVSNNVIGGPNVILSSSSSVPPSQHSAVHPNFVASTHNQQRPSLAQPLHKGTFVGIQPKGMTAAVAARTAIAPKGSNLTGEAATGSSSIHHSVSTPLVMIGGPHHPSYQQLASSQQQFFLASPNSAILTLQAQPQHVQQQHHSTFGNVQIMPSTSTSSSTVFGIPSADAEQHMQKNGLVGSIPNSSRPVAANSLNAKVTPPKRKRKMDAKNAMAANSTTSAPTALSIYTDPSKSLSQHQLVNDPSTVDEEENEPPPVLCRVFNRSEDEPIVSTQSMETVFQREAKIIRERIYDANGKKFGPLKHLIDGFEIEEDIEPFPCEHRQLLDKLKREQAGLEAEIDGEMQNASKPGAVSPAENNAENAAQRRRGRKRAAAAASSLTSSSASSPTRSPKRANAMETDAAADGATDTTDVKAHQQHQSAAEEEHAFATAGDSATESSASAVAVRKGRRRELVGLLKMDFGKNCPFPTKDPDKYEQEVLIEQRQQQRTLALAQDKGTSKSLRSKHMATPYYEYFYDFDEDEYGGDIDGTEWEQKFGHLFRNPNSLEAQIFTKMEGEEIGKTNQKHWKFEGIIDVVDEDSAKFEKEKLGGEDTKITFEEQRNVRRSVESSGGGSTTGKSSKRDKHAKKPFSPPVSPLPTVDSRAVSAQSTAPQKAKAANMEKAFLSSAKIASTSAVGKEGTLTTTTLENKLKTSPKDSFSLEQRQSSGSNASEEGEERCLCCRRSFKEVGRDKDHVQYCSKACRKQLKAAKRMKHSGGSLEEGLNTSTSMAGDEARNGVVSATPSHRRSDPSSSNDSQQQQSSCQINSPLGSAFSAMQPQMLSKRRLPVDQHAEQLMSLQRLSGNNGSGLAPSFAPTPYGQSPTDQTPALLAVPMPIRQTPGAPQTMIHGTPTMYLNVAHNHHQLVVSSSGTVEQQQQMVAGHLYQQQQQQAQQQHEQQHMSYTPGTLASAVHHPHFFSPAGPSGPHTGTPTFIPPPMVRQSPLTTATASSSSPATPVPNASSFVERNVDIEMLMSRGMHSWTKEDVSKWVNFVTASETNGDRFVEEDVDGASLLFLSQEQLKTDLKLKLGPAVKLWSALEALKRNTMCERSTGGY